MISEAPSPQVKKLVRQAKEYAALSGVFDPGKALPAKGDAEPDEILAVTSALAAACDTNPDTGTGWVLRSSERRNQLDELRKEGRLEDAIEQRRSTDSDLETSDLLLALEGKGPFSTDAMARDLAQPAEPERVQRIVVALERAGSDPKLLDRARVALAAIGREERRRQLDERGFCGRQAEQEKLLSRLKRPVQVPSATAAFLSGLPGIGKSALIEEVVRQLSDGEQAATVRLDFDRAGLDVLDILGLTMEVARQLGERLGEAGQPLIAARLAAASQQVGEDGLAQARRSTFPTLLAQEIGTAVGKAGRPITLVLDTLEVLRARGVQHPQSLFNWIDQLIQYGLQPLRILAAGRGNALDGSETRIGIRIDLDGLDDHAALELLARLDVPAAAQSEILRIAAGNPLVLRLGAEVVRRFGTGELPKEALQKDVAAAFLYRFLLSRIDDPLLRKLAHPGLVTRRISAALIREVLADVMDVPDLSISQAQEAFDALASQHWLVMRDPLDPEFVIHRSDMRLVLLPLLYKEQPELCAEIDQKAMTWFGRRKDQASQIDAVYHRLQLLRRRSARPPISSALAQRFDDAMLAELPEKARQIVLRARGGRTNLYQSSESYVAAHRGVADDAAVASELLSLLDRHDWGEGQYVVDRIVDEGGFDPQSQTADAVRAFYWRSGRWSLAQRLLRERDQLGPDDSDLLEIPWPLALARLEMRAEFTAVRLDRILKGPIAERLTSDLNRQGGTPARSGALAFMLLARDERFLQESSFSKDADPIAGALYCWSDGKSDMGRRALDLARDRLQSHGVHPKADSPSVQGQLLAIHSPYVVFAANLATQQRREWLVPAAADAGGALAEAGGLFVPKGQGAFRISGSNPFADLADLGLFAEWADCIGFVARDPDLRLIGKAAERWRRTAAGYWSYVAAHPRRWADERRLDAVIEARVTEALHEAPSGRWDVGLWRDRHARPVALEMLYARIPRSIAVAIEQPDPIEKARALLRARVPAAFVPALVEDLQHRSRGFAIS